MLATFYIDNMLLCEAFEPDINWNPPKSRITAGYMGSVNNGYIKLPEIVNKEFGEYNFKVIFEGECTVTSFKGLLRRTITGDNYIEIISGITEEEL